VRLLYLTDRLSDRGGADHHLATVITSSVNAGHRVSVVFGRDEGGMEMEDVVERRRVRGLASLVDSNAGLHELPRLLEDADVVHIQNVMNPVALAMAVGCGRSVVTVQDHRVFCPGGGKTMTDGSRCTTPMADEVCSHCLPDPVYRRSTLDLTRRRLAAIQGAEVVVLSEFMAAELAAMGRRGARVVAPWIEPGPQKSDPGSVFLLGGRLVSHKGVVDGWRAWREAGRPLPLEVAGAGPLGSEMHGAELLGWLNPEDLRTALRRSRALIFPARWQEPFGILGLEALAQGTPVIVAESGGTPDWSMAGCIRVASGDVAAMAEAVGRLADDPELGLTIGRAGQTAVGRRFGRERLEPRLHDLYAHVAGRSLADDGIHS